MKLLAYTPQERWAFIEIDESILFLRPPYEQDDTVTRSAVERAVTVGGYLTSGREFANRETLREFLEAESVRVWREQYPTQTLSSLQEDMLTVLTVADIDRQMLRAQKKLDDGRAHEANKLLVRLVAAAHATPEQRARMSTMMQTASKMMDRTGAPGQSIPQRRRPRRLSVSISMHPSLA